MTADSDCWPSKRFLTDALTVASLAVAGLGGAYDVTICRYPQVTQHTLTTLVDAVSSEQPAGDTDESTG
jgi:hypothetical protein